MPVIEKTINGATFRFHEVDGTTWPEPMLMMVPERNIEKQLKAIQDLKMKEDDVTIATYPKSGTHWIWEIVSMLVKGKAEYETKPKESAMLEFQPMEFVEKIPSPRVLNTHIPSGFLPKEIGEKKCKVIHVQRNPKDMAVSLYNHSKAMSKHKKSEEKGLINSWPDLLPMLMGDYGVYMMYPWFKYVLEFEQYQKENPKTCLNLYYEDMKEDPVGAVKRVAEFLDIKCDESLIKDIALACDFDAMKKANSELKEAVTLNHSSQTMPKHEKSMFYRKGQVGDWKNWFTVAQNERFEKWLSENLVNTELRFKYTL